LPEEKRKNGNNGTLPLLKVEKRKSEILTNITEIFPLLVSGVYKF
jgi:hypothetical protein